MEFVTFSRTAFENSVTHPHFVVMSSGVPREVVWGVQTPPEIPKVSVESSIAWARRTGISICFCSSLCSHTVVIYYIKVSFNTNCLAVAYLVLEFKPTLTSQKFDKVNQIANW